MILQKGKRKRDVTLALLHFMSFYLERWKILGVKILKWKLNISKKSKFNEQESFFVECRCNIE